MRSRERCFLPQIRWIKRKKARNSLISHNKNPLGGSVPRGFFIMRNLYNVLIPFVDSLISFSILPYFRILIYFIRFSPYKKSRLGIPSGFLTNHLSGSIPLPDFHLHQRFSLGYFHLPDCLRLFSGCGEVPMSSDRAVLFLHPFHRIHF